MYQLSSSINIETKYEGRRAYGVTLLQFLRCVKSSLSKMIKKKKREPIVHYMWVNPLIKMTRNPIRLFLSDVDSEKTTALKNEKWD